MVCEISGRHTRLKNESEQPATGRIRKRKAQKFGYRNKRLISPKKGPQSSDSFFSSSLMEGLPGRPRTLIPQSGKRENEEANFDHGTRVITGV